MPALRFPAATRNLCLAILLVLSTAWPAGVAAALQYSPLVHIVGLEVLDGRRTLRIAVQLRTYAPDVFNFNPANCGTPKAFFNRNGANFPVEVFDFELGASGRSAEKHHQVLNQIYGAFATSRMVRIAVLDDLCTDDNRPVAGGILVEH